MWLDLTPVNLLPKYCASLHSQYRLAVIHKSCLYLGRSYCLGNAKLPLISSSVPGVGMKTKYVLLLINHTHTMCSSFHNSHSPHSSCLNSMPLLCYFTEKGIEEQNGYENCPVPHTWWGKIELSVYPGDLASESVLFTSKESVFFFRTNFKSFISFYGSSC